MYDPLAPETPKSRVEQLLRDAHLHRVRKQWGEAETLCRQALEIAPEDVGGMEMLGDLLAEKGNTDEALEIYRKCLELQPDKVTLEGRIARLALRKSEEERDRLAAELLLSSPKEKAQQKRKTTIAVVLSMLFPGAGQLYLGEYAPGGIMLALGLLTFWVGGPDLMRWAMSFTSSGEQGNGLLAFVGFLGVIVYGYSLLDAAKQRGPKSGWDV